MANVVQTYGGLTNEQKTFYERTLLSRLKPDLVFQKYGQKKPIPKREGDTVNFRRFESLPPATTALTEGVTPDGNNLNVTSIKATVQQYGDYITISDKLDMVGIDPVLTETAALHGEQAALTVDTLIRDVVCAGTNVQYSGGKTSRATLIQTDVLTAKDVKLAVRTLKSANVKKVKEANAYIGICDPATEFDLTNDPLWIDVSKYNGGQKIMDGEIGKLHGVRFIVTTNTKVWDGDVDVHATMIIGSDAYGVCDVEGSSKPQMIVKSHGSSGTADPLNQRATSGWKTLMTAIRLNELAMVRIESAVSA